MTASLFAGFETFAELLIEKGANVNVVGPLGFTPLILAAEKSKKLAFTHTYYLI